MTRKQEKQLVKHIDTDLLDNIIIEEVPGFKAPAAIRYAKNMGALVMLYNGALLDKMNKEGVPADLIGYHEILHFLLGHLDCDIDCDEQKLLNSVVKGIRKWESLTPEEREEVNKFSMLRNVAADLEVNSYIPEIQDSDCVHPLQPNFNYPEHLHFSEYYELLKQNPPAMFQQPDGSVLVEIDKDGKKAKVHVSGDSLSPEEKRELEKQIQEHFDRKGWDLEANPEAGKTKVKEVTCHNNKAVKSVQSALYRMVARDLHQYFHKTASFSRPHKWKDEGQPGKKRKRGPRVAFCLDCSGSTSGEQQQEYYGLVKRFLQKINGVIVEFDTKVQHVGKRLSGKQWCGGTNFKVVDAELKKLKVDAVIWFTDGQGEFDMTPSRVKHFIILTDTYNIDHVMEKGKVFLHNIDE